ncbi:MAG: hypothetical protein AAF628_01915 [Planctomycetota bacterium]
MGWVLKSWNVGEVAGAAGLAARASQLEQLRDDLLVKIAGGGPQG